MGDISKFLKTLNQDAEAKELLRNQPKPASDEEAAAAYVCVAEKMGFSVTKEEMLNSLKGLELIQRMKTGHSEADVKKALDENDLEQVAGGGEDPRCLDSFSPGEWCWFSDSCSYIITGYGDEAVAGKIEPEMVGEKTGAEDLIEDKWIETIARCSKTAYWDMLEAYDKQGLLENPIYFSN